MKIICAISLILASLLVSRPVEAQRLKFDHAIIAVHDLERASATFGRLGFTVAPLPGNRF